MKLNYCCQKMFYFADRFDKGYWFCQYGGVFFIIK